MSDNGNNKITIDCPYCKQRFSVLSPTTAIFNDLRSSSTVSPHEKPIKCINNKCAKFSVIIIGQVQIGWGILPITDEQAASLDVSRILVPPLPMKLIH